jgi:hypothetical protein
MTSYAQFLVLLKKTWNDGWSFEKVLLYAINVGKDYVANTTAFVLSAKKICNKADFFLKW